MNAEEAEALRLASDQYGVVTRQQAFDRGMTEDQVDHRLATGRLVRVHPTVYRVAGAPVTARQRAMAACLWLGESAVVSHETAAALLHLDGIRRAPLHVTAMRTVRRGVNVDVHFNVHSTRRLDRIDRVVVDGIPCTAATRTLIDIAPLVDDEKLEIAFESARRMGLTSVHHLAQRFTALGRRAGTPKVRHLLEHQHVGDRPLESPLEVKMWRLIRESDLPLPERQVRIPPYRVDALWRTSWLILECDGFEAHAGYLRWKRDRRRVAFLEALGYRVVHVTWDHVTERPDEVLERVRLALARAA